MFSIKTRLIALYTFLFGILLVFVAFSTLFVIERMYITKIDAYLMAYSTAIEETLSNRGIQGVLNSRGEHLVPAEKQEKMLETFRIFHQFTENPVNVRTRLTELSGKIYIDDQVLSSGARAPSQRYRQPSGVGITTVTINNIEYRVFTKRLVSPAHPSRVFVLEVAASLADIDNLKDEVNHKHFHIIGFALLITGLIAYFIIRVSFKPVTKMAKTASIISAGTLDRRLELPKAKDEIRMLGETLNAMIDRIADSFNTQQQFIADASHEIRTPLTIIQAELELALKQIKEPEAREGIETSLQELEHLNSLTASLLTLARLDASETVLDIEPVRIDEVLAECIQGLQNVAQKKNLTLDLSIAEAFEIPGDREKLKKMFRNIIENAVKYSPTGKNVSVRLESQSPTHIRVTVKDNGAGISEQALPHVFNRFYRDPELRSEVSGSGLGLAIVKKIADLHHAEISLKSVKDSGTTVNILLPRADST